MANANDGAIQALNYLIGTCIDGINGYAEAADEATSHELKVRLTQLGQQRVQLRDELEAEVTRLGGEPKEHGSVGAALHRTWLNVREAISGKGDDAILKESRRGERAALDNYEDVLRRDIPAGIKELALSQQKKLYQAHDELETFRLSNEPDAY